VDALQEFAEGEVKIAWDRDVRGLQVRVGKHRVTWSFLKEHRIHGKRGVSFKRLGFFPAMDAKAARQAALIEAGRVASGRITPGRKTAIKFHAALDDYIAHARQRAEKKGKAASWARNIESLKRTHFADFLGWPLHELSASPAVVATWHKRVTKDGGPNIANQAARVMRAAYRRAARLDRSLPPHSPTSAVEFNAERRSQNAMKFTDFPKWWKAWDDIESPSRKAFQMINLLAGNRPGELSRIKWRDVLPRERCFVIRGAKADNDVRVPMSAAIGREFKRARDASVKGNDYVFPARAGGHIVKFDVDGLPAHGMALRRTWRTVAAECGVDELLAHFMLGHIPAGISRGYVAKLILSSGSAMRAAQRIVSRRIGSSFENAKLQWRRRPGDLRSKLPSSKNSAGFRVGA
jgi:integrase